MAFFRIGFPAAFWLACLSVAGLYIAGKLSAIMKKRGISLSGGFSGGNSEKMSACFAKINRLLKMLWAGTSVIVLPMFNGKATASFNAFVTALLLMFGEKDMIGEAGLIAAGLCWTMLTAGLMAASLLIFCFFCIRVINLFGGQIPSSHIKTDLIPLFFIQAVLMGIFLPSSKEMSYFTGF